MEGLEEAAYSGGIAGVFAMVFAEFTCGAVERPGFGYFYSQEFDDDVKGFYSREVVGEVCADAERWLAFVAGIVVDADGFIDVKAVAENDLFCGGIDVERAVFVDDEVELLIVVAAVDS